LILLGIVGFFWLTGYDALIDLTESWDKEAQIEQAIHQIEQENEQIEGAIKELAPNGKAVEQIARQELGWAKHGEIVVKIPEKK